MSLERIFSRYNGDFDIIPDGPAVTWAEFELANYVVQLAKRMKQLEERVASLESFGLEEPANTGSQADGRVRTCKYCDDPVDYPREDV